MPHFCYTVRAAFNNFQSLTSYWSRQLTNQSDCRYRRSLAETGRWAEKLWVLELRRSFQKLSSKSRPRAENCFSLQPSSSRSFQKLSSKSQADLFCSAPKSWAIFFQLSSKSRADLFFSSAPNLKPIFFSSAPNLEPIFFQLSSKSRADVPHLSLI